MDLGLRGKVAIVGGASQGIGRGIARMLAAEGANLVVWARRNPALDDTATAIRDETGASVVPVLGDVRKAEDHARIVQTTLDRFGRVDILVNNDGAPPLGRIADFDDEAWTKAIGQNLMSVVRMSRLCIPSMRANGGGRIVNITALSVLRPRVGFGLSVATWAGVIGFAKTLSREVGPDGITVNTICPGRIDTDLLRRSLKAQAEVEKRDLDSVLADSMKQVPIQRLGTPEDIAALVAFLASRHGAFLTGMTLQADGGALESLL
jgi:3-oxoacyl-[acyl-carrier protein] reductase